uniref:Uncharacterized protein n=1 Tax=Setaria viridis TaxID=4556 RepID=A0A4U6V4V0_SETVI|nr:hypothetical protein SEVIR_4G261901v2 [Setaria viridis]
MFFPLLSAAPSSLPPRRAPPSLIGSSASPSPTSIIASFPLLLHQSSLSLMRWRRLRRGLHVEDLRSFGEAQSSSSTAQSSSGEAQSSSRTANRAGHEPIELQRGSPFVHGCLSHQPKRCSLAGRSAALPQLHSRAGCSAAPAPAAAPCSRACFCSYAGPSAAPAGCSAAATQGSAAAPAAAPLPRAAPQRVDLLNGRRWKRGR